MEDLLNQFGLMTTTKNQVCTKYEQLYMFREEARLLLRNGCTEFQFVKLANFNELIKKNVNLNDDIYPERLSGLLLFIRNHLFNSSTGELHDRLLSTYQLYDSIITLLSLEEEIESNESYNYYKQTNLKPNDGFWNEM